MAWIAPVIMAGGSLLGGMLSSKGSSDAADTESQALVHQTNVQNRAARDFLATGMDYDREQRDIMLTGTEANRNAGALALAGMMDLAGLNRAQLPGTGGGTQAGFPSAPGSTRPVGIGGRTQRPGGPGEAVGFPGDFDETSNVTWNGQGYTQDELDELMVGPTVNAGSWGNIAVPYANKAGVGWTSSWPNDDRTFNTRQGAKDASYPGQSMYEPELTYDLDRLNDPNRILTGAEQYDFQADPGYQFRLDESRRALEHSFAADTGTKSGAYDLALMERSGQFASAEYGNVFDRLSTLAGFTAGSAPQGGTGQGTIQNFGNQAIESYGGISAAGAARGQGQVGQANAWANAINQGAQGIAYGMSGYGGGGYGGGNSGGNYNVYDSYAAASSNRFS